MSGFRRTVLPRSRAKKVMKEMVEEETDLKQESSSKT